MKIKNLLKKDKTTIKNEEAPKGFEEFNIDKEVLDELDSLLSDEETVNHEDNKLDEEPIEKNEVNKEEIIEVIDKPKQEQIVDAASAEFVTIVRNNIDFCAKEIKDISSTMDKIEAQKSSESFWKKSENIKIISKHVNKMSEIQQKTLDLLVMFLGASGKMADDYDTILKTIDELGELNGGEAEVLNYLLKVKKMIKEIKNNDERLKSIVFDLEKQKEKTNTLEKYYNEKVNTYEKYSKITSSKIHKLTGRCNRLATFLFISYILIIAIGIILYIKLFK